MQENSFQENLFGHDTATIGTQAFHHWLSWVLSIFSRQFVFFVNGFDSFVDFYGGILVNFRSRLRYRIDSWEHVIAKVLFFSCDSVDI